jgi:OOP family OmpA-OmpF porin
MNKSTIAVVTLALSQGLLIQVAQADEPGYLGLRMGYSELSSNACTLDSPCDDGSFGGGVYGGYNFNQYVALEAGLDILGDFKTNLGTAASGDALMKAVTLAPKFTYPISQEFDIFAKIGGAYMNYDGDSDVVPTGSLGLEYQLTKGLNARLEYQRYQDFTDTIVKDLDVNFFGLGLTYLFGSPEPEAMSDSEARPVSEAPAPQPAAEPVVTTVAATTAAATEIGKKQQNQLFDQGTFESGSAKLSDGGMESLKPLRDLLAAHPMARAEIVGHTDSGGSEEYNQALSEARAQAVADFLVEGGVSREQLIVEGDGELFPIATNETEEGRAQNRRVEVTIPSFEYDEI